MSHTRSIAFDSARASRRCPFDFLALGLAALVAVGCGNHLQKTAVDIGGGVKKGDPPMCFQYRVEARPTTRANNIWVHLNNTCSYDVDCNVWDSVTEQTHRMFTPAYQTRSFLIAPEVQETRVNTKFECTWKP